MAKARVFDKIRQYAHSKAPIPGMFSTLDEAIAVSPREAMSFKEWREWLQPGRMLHREGVQFPLKKAELEDSGLTGVLDFWENDSPDRIISRKELFEALSDVRPTYTRRISDTGDWDWERTKRLEELNRQLDEAGIDDVVGVTEIGGGEPVPRQRHVDQHNYENYDLHHRSVRGGDEDGYLEDVTELVGLAQKRRGAAHFGYDTLSWNRATRHPVVDNEGNTGFETVRLIEEIQSDYGQRGHRQGFLTPELVEELEQLRFQRDAIPDEVIQSNPEAWRELEWRINKLETMYDPVPYATDPKEYARLELSKAILDAIDNEEDYVALVSGQDQVDRYGRGTKSAGQEYFYDTIYPSVLKQLGKRYGGEMTTVKVPIRTQKVPRLEYFLDEFDGEFETIQDWASATSKEMLEDGDADDIELVIDSLYEIEQELRSKPPSNPNAAGSLARASDKLSEMDELFSWALDPDDARDDAHRERLIKDRMEQGSAVRMELSQLFDVITSELSGVEAWWRTKNTVFKDEPKEFKALKITPEMAKKVRAAGIPMYAKGGRVYRKGPGLYEGALKSIKEGRTEEGAKMLEELKTLLGLSEEDFWKMINSGIERPDPRDKINPLKDVYDPESPLGGYWSRREKMAKGGKPPRSPLIDAAELFKKRGEQRLDPTILEHMQKVGLEPPENVTKLSEWVSPEEQALGDLTQEDVFNLLTDDVDLDITPPTPEFEEWYKGFRKQLEDRLAAKNDQIAQMQSQGQFRFRKGDKIWSAQTGKKFDILDLHIGKDGDPQYLVEGPDGSRHHMAEWGMLGKPPEPADIRVNKDRVRGVSADETDEWMVPRWANRDDYDRIGTLLYDYTERDLGDLQIVQDPNRPGVFAAIDMDRVDPDDPMYEGFIIDFNQGLDIDSGLIEEVQFNEWPPKPRSPRRYAEGGGVKKDRKALNYLRSVAQSLAGAIPFTSPSFHEAAGEAGYKLGALPTAGFKTQWWGVDPDTGESVYAGPFSGDETPGMDALPGIVDETAGLPIFGSLVTGGLLPIPEFSEMAAQRMEENEENILEELGLDYPSGFLENTLYSGGIMAGQLPVPATALKTLLGRGKQVAEPAVGWLQKIARTPGKVGEAGVEFLFPTIDPTIKNYMAGTLFGGGLMTGFEKLFPPETENEALIRATYEGSIEAFEELRYRAFTLEDPEAMAAIEELRNQLMEEQALEERIAPIGQVRMPGEEFAKGGRASRESIERLRKLGDLQRGDPERAMLRVQHTMGGGVLNPVVEHTGDLTHRMSHHAEYDTAYPDLVKDKLERVLHRLTYPYGFEREMKENIQTNARALGVPEDELKAKLDEKLSQYAEEHSKLPVYNRPNYWARRAAVAVGNQDWQDAQLALEKLKELVDLGPTEFSEMALTTYDTGRYAKGGKVGRRDFLKGLLGAGAAAVAGTKAGMKGDPESMLKAIEESIEVPSAVAKVVPPTPGRFFEPDTRILNDALEYITTERLDIEPLDSDYLENANQAEKAIFELRELLDKGDLQGAKEFYFGEIADTHIEDYLTDMMLPEEAARFESSLGFEPYHTLGLEDLNEVERTKLSQMAKQAWTESGGDLEKMEDFLYDLSDQGLDVEDISNPWWKENLPEYTARREQLMQQELESHRLRREAREAKLPPIEKAHPSTRRAWVKKRDELLKILNDKRRNIDSEAFRDAADEWDELMDTISDRGFQTLPWDEMITNPKLHYKKYAKGGKVTRRDMLKGLLGAGATAVAGGKAAMKGDPESMLKDLEVTPAIKATNNPRRVAARLNDWEGFERSAYGETMEEALAKLKQLLIDEGHAENMEEVDFALKEHGTLYGREDPELPDDMNEVLEWVRPFSARGEWPDERTMSGAEMWMKRISKERGVPYEEVEAEFLEWLNKEIAEAEEFREHFAKGGKIINAGSRFAQKAGKYKNPDIEVPEGYVRFESRMAPSGKSWQILGVPADNPNDLRVISTTTSQELAEILAAAYNAGGYTDKALQRIWLQDYDDPEYAKGGKVSRRDVLKGILGAGATAVAGGKAAMKGDPETMLKNIEAGIKATPAAPTVRDLTKPFAKQVLTEPERAWLNEYLADKVRDYQDDMFNYRPEEGDIEFLTDLRSLANKAETEVLSKQEYEVLSELLSDAASDSGLDAFEYGTQDLEDTFGLVDNLDREFRTPAAEAEAYFESGRKLVPDADPEALEVFRDITNDARLWDDRHEYTADDWIDSGYSPEQARQIVSMVRGKISDPVWAQDRVLKSDLKRLEELYPKLEDPEALEEFNDILEEWEMIGHDPRAVTYWLSNRNLK